MFWDYHKTRIYTSLTMTISAFVAIFVILNAINLAGKVPFQLVLVAYYAVTVLYLPYFLIKGVLVKDKKLVIETDALMQKLATHEPIPPQRASKGRRTHHILGRIQEGLRSHQEDDYSGDGSFDCSTGLGSLHLRPDVTQVPGPVSRGFISRVVLL